MFYRRKQEGSLPGWLWFFLILPLGLLVALLYRQKQVREFARRLGEMPKQVIPVRRRYVEPDSIPLEIRPAVPPAGGKKIAPVITTHSGYQELILEKPEEAPSNAQDDLTIIEGIGPKISEHLRRAGIFTFHQLAETPIERLNEILTAARLRHLANPGTWPEQARLAAAGDRAGLAKLQDSLKGGRRVSAA